MILPTDILKALPPYATGIIILVALASVALYKIDIFEDVLAQKLGKDIHVEQHKTDGLRVHHVEKAIVDLVQHHKELAARMETVNYHLQTRQDSQFKTLLEAIER